jgi:hypothetical protein
MKQVQIFAAGRVLVRANQHLFRPASSGDQADTGFHQADIRLCGRLNSRRVQTDLTSATEGHALWRGNHRLRRIFESQVDVLKLLYGHVQVVPLLFLGGNQHEH